MRIFPSIYEGLDPIQSVTPDDKVSLLSRIDRFTRGLDPRVKEVSVRIGSTHEVVYVYSSEGVGHGDIRPLVRFQRLGNSGTGWSAGAGLKWRRRTTRSEMVV